MSAFMPRVHARGRAGGQYLGHHRFGHISNNFMPFFMQLCTSCFHGSRICMWFGFNPAVNFCHFSTLLT